MATVGTFIEEVLDMKDGTRIAEALPCIQVDPQDIDRLFFPEKIVPRDLERAQRVCRPCPVAVNCLAWAWENRQTGVWGGELLKKGTLRSTRPSATRAKAA